MNFICVYIDNGLRINRNVSNSKLFRIFFAQVFLIKLSAKPIFSASTYRIYFLGLEIYSFLFVPNFFLLLKLALFLICS